MELDGIPYDAKFVFEKVGYNLEGSEIGAAFGLVQLEKLSNNISTRQLNFKIQKEFFDGFPDIFISPNENQNAETAWLAFPIIIKEDAPFTRKEFQIYLEKNNIQTRVVFTGNILRQPMTSKMKKRVNSFGYPNADQIMKNGVLLPVHHGLTDSMFENLHKIIKEFVDSKIH